jgi:hypothetical protein
LYVPYLCLKAEGAGGRAPLPDAVELTAGSDPFELASHGYDCRSQRSHRDRIFRGKGMDHRPRLLIAAFSRISACIGFSFRRLAACKELSVGIRPLSLKPLDEVELDAG